MSMFDDLQRKAYSQGFSAGLMGFDISQADWEPEFLPEYNRGYADGKKEAARIDEADKQ